LILVDDQNEEKTRVAEEIERCLSDYPILDDEKFSSAMESAISEFWEECGMRERIQYCSDYGISIFAARHNYIPDNDGLRECLESEFI
jgi:hypothetical protein